MNQNQEIFASSLNLQPTDTALFINGLYFDLEVVDILTLLESLRVELRVMEALHTIGKFFQILEKDLVIQYYFISFFIGFNDKKMSKLLALDLSGNDDSQDFAIDIRDSAIIWINDIENDSRYSRWPLSISELLRPTFPGMLRNLRRNLYNLVLIIDPLNPDSMSLFSLVGSLYSHSAPLRIGFVFLMNYNTSITGLQDPSIAVNNAFHYFAENKTPKEALRFLSEVIKLYRFNLI